MEKITNSIRIQELKNYVSDLHAQIERLQLKLEDALELGSHTLINNTRGRIYQAKYSLEKLKEILE